MLGEKVNRGRMSGENNRLERDKEIREPNYRLLKYPVTKLNCQLT